MIRNKTAMVHARLKPHQKRVDYARDVVSRALDRMSKPYVAFSTGKDSVCTAALVWEQAPDVPAVYFDADNAFPDTYGLLERLEQAGRTIIRWPTEPLFDTFTRHGGPLADGIGHKTMISTVYEPIQALQSEYHFDGVFVGLRADENEGRAKLIYARGPIFDCARDGVVEALPVCWWSYWDVWAYILTNELDYNRTYDLMLDMPLDDQRLSYWAGETKAAWGRWVFLQRHFPALWNAFAARFPEVRTHA
jgi:3'-phosphoadenosine 5'-phosphosulfate sulfotransferase (PAPS reductase)/FAD synthetase